MTDEQIYAAGAAAVSEWPPLPERVLERLAVILAPLAETHSSTKEDDRASSAEAA